MLYRLQNNKPAMLPTGNKMILMYGGTDTTESIYSTDLWHLKINPDHVLYEKVQYDTKGTAYMISWRSGFTMEYIRGFNDPYLIGGTYGNNQQIQTLFSIPEQECSSLSDFKTTTCSPCPQGSLYSKIINDCKWCEKYEYFNENFDDYFKSTCVPCPRGLVGGSFQECFPCEAGFIFSPEAETHCKKCSDDKICPVGTKFEFDSQEFSAEMEELKMNNKPNIFESNNSFYSRIPTIVILILIFLTFTLILSISALLFMCKERWLFIFRELDMPPITGGKKRKVIGGILTIFFSMYICIIWIGFIIDFSLFNQRRETSETSNPLLQRELSSSYEIEVEAYCSIVKESKMPLLENISNIDGDFETNSNNLCDKINLNVFDSYYFKSANVNNIKCTRERLNGLTDKYKIKLEYSNIPKAEIKNQFVSIELKSMHTQVFHFFRWRLKSIWDKQDNIPTAWSELQGVITPQITSNSNKNITSGFKGEIPTVINFSLIPTHFVDESANSIHKGYRVNLLKVERGSTVNKRTITQKYISADEISEGFKVQFMISTSQTLYQVRVQRIKSSIEVLAFMFGFLAGLILLLRGVKYYLLKDTYFSNLEKQCDRLFGRVQKAKYEDEDDEDINNISLKKLERSRIRVMDNSVLFNQVSDSNFEKNTEENENTLQLDKTVNQE